MITSDYKPDSKYDRNFDLSSFPFKSTQAPSTWDWRDANGMNYLSWTKTQQSPLYCGAGWAQAATSAFADCLNIQRRQKNSRNPLIAISPQAMIDCLAGGDCSGGDYLGVFDYAQSTGVPEDTCQNYMAQNNGDSCDPITVCKTCVGPAAPEGEDGQENCVAVTDFPKHSASSYGVVNGVDAMKQAIYGNGPIACSIQSTSGFLDYTGGVYKESLSSISPNHVVSLVGWGETENGEAYWIGRNSWATYWGEWGFFRIAMGSNTLGIESDCGWAIPA